MRWNTFFGPSGQFRLVVFVLALGTACRGGNGMEHVDGPGRVVGGAVPAGAKVVVSGYDLEGLWARFSQSQLVTQLESIEGFDEAMAPVDESRRDFEAETGLPLDEETVMTIFGGRFDIAFYGSLPEDRADIALVAEIEDTDRAREIAEALEERATEGEGATFRDLELAGTSIRVGSDREGDDALFYRLDERRLLLSTTEARMVETLELLTNVESARSMADEEPYRETMSRFPSAAITVYVDQEAIREAAAHAGDSEPEGETEEERLGRERLAAASTALEQSQLASAVGIALRWSGEGLLGETYARFPEVDRSPIVDMLTVDAGPMRSLDYMPDGTLLFSSINTLDARVLYDELYRYAVEATRIQMDVAGTPDSLRADQVVASEIEAFESETGIDLEEDVISWVGNEASFAVAGVDNSGFFPIPEIAFAVSVTDPQRARGLMTRLEEIAAEAARQQLSIPIQWRSEEVDGVTVRYAPSPLGEGLSLSYAVGEDMAIVASNLGLVQGMLDVVGGRSPGLRSNERFGAMEGFFPEEATVLGFVDVEGILTEVQSLLSTYGALSGNASSADSTGVAYQLLDALKNAPRAGFYSVGEEDGLRGGFLIEIL